MAQIQVQESKITEQNVLIVNLTAKHEQDIAKLVLQQEREIANLTKLISDLEEQEQNYRIILDKQVSTHSKIH